MREIKFRAWDKEDKRMIIDEQDFIPVKVTNKGVLRLNPHHKENFWEFIDEERFEIMQYTGIKDKNGREIYEGDIISTDLDRPFNIVVFRNGAFMFQCHDNGKDYYDYMFSVEEESDRWEYGEVIGNIYENPELLEGTA